MKRLIMATLLIMLSAAITALAGSAGDCSCRAKDVVAYEGQVVCLSTPNGKRLAVCEKVLNNTSWKFLSEECPADKFTQRPFNLIQPKAVKSFGFPLQSDTSLPSVPRGQQVAHPTKDRV